MRNLTQNQSDDVKAVDPRWKDLYRLGGIAFALVALLIVAAIVAFFIWPFKPGFSSTADIFALLSRDRLGGLMSLDLCMLVIVFLNLLPILALYAALRKVNESYALIAMVLGLVAEISLIPARPLAEMVWLSEKYALASSEVAKSQYLAAGEALHALFNGTAWMVQTVLFCLWGLINSCLMMKSSVFGKPAAYLGLGVYIVGLGFFLPVIGMPLLFVNTIGSVVWYIMLSGIFFQITGTIRV